MKVNIGTDTNFGNNDDVEVEHQKDFEMIQDEVNDGVVREITKESEIVQRDEGNISLLEQPAEVSFLAGPSTKKAKISSSSVHDEFEHIKVPDKKTGTTKDGRVCKLCEFVFEHKVTTALKTHLERRHPDVYSRVAARDEAMLDKKASQDGSLSMKVNIGKDTNIGNNDDVEADLEVEHQKGLEMIQE